MSDFPERDHGYGKPPEVEGVPVILNENEEMPPCPNCGCARTFTIQVTLVEGPPQLRVPEGSKVIGIYPSCPACPWAGPMAMSARAEN